MKLTEREKEVISAVSFNSKEIMEGELNEKELSLLNEMRAVEKSLKEKYPGHGFSIISVETKFGTSRDYNEWVICENGDREKITYNARTRNDGTDIEVKDTCYEVLVKEDLAKKVADIVTGGGFSVVKVKAGCGKFLGNEYGEGISANQIFDGKIDAGNDFSIILDGSKLDHGSYGSNVDEIRELMVKKNAAGYFYIIFLTKADGDVVKDRAYSGWFRITK